jgi:hypothetical protein
MRNEGLLATLSLFQLVDGDESSICSRRKSVELFSRPPPTFL